MANSATLIWNGPLGVFEVPPFDKGTVGAAHLASIYARAGKLVAVAGGGDTVAALNHAGVAEDFTFVSTAGGAFLEWMEGKPLPGVPSGITGPAAPPPPLLPLPPQAVKVNAKSADPITINIERANIFASVSGVDLRVSSQSLDGFGSEIPIFANMTRFGRFNAFFQFTRVHPELTRGGVEQALCLQLRQLKLN
jgi:hypothetical protein